MEETASIEARFRRDIQGDEENQNDRGNRRQRRGDEREQHTHDRAQRIADLLPERFDDLLLLLFQLLLILLLLLLPLLLLLLQLLLLRRILLLRLLWNGSGFPGLIIGSPPEPPVDIVDRFRQLLFQVLDLRPKGRRNHGSDSDEEPEKRNHNRHCAKTAPHLPAFQKVDPR